MAASIEAYLSEFVKRKEAEIADLKARSDASEDVKEVRAIGAQIDALGKEIEEARAQIAAVPKFDPAAAMGFRQAAPAPAEAREEPTATTEYREAFREYVTRGIDSPVLKRANDRTVTADIGAIIPKTIMDGIIRGLSGKYGQLYSRVRKLNVPGGVQFAAGSLSATFYRPAEESTGASPSDRQNAGSLTAVVFGYFLGEIRLATSLVAATVALDVWEATLADVIAEAYIKAMDKEIMRGSAASRQCTGIITEAEKVSGSRIPAGNTLSVEASEGTSWVKWQEKIFAKLPVAFRAKRPVIYMSVGTWESVVKTMKDSQNAPVYTEIYNPVDGTETARLRGWDVVFVEEDILATFGDIDLTGTDSPYFLMIANLPEAYGINSNREFGIRRYFDEEKNEIVTKALVINDGQVLDGTQIYLVKKVADTVRYADGTLTVQRDLPAGSQALWEGETVTKIVIAAGVASLGDEVFKDMDDVEEVDMSAAAGLSIGKKCFAGCTGVTAVKFGATIGTLGTDWASSWTFKDSAGSATITKTAANLKGKSFAGTASALLDVTEGSRWRQAPCWPR